MMSHGSPAMEVSNTIDETNAKAADWLAMAILESVDARGCCGMAVSGGHSPWPMFSMLAKREDVPWTKIRLFQVDERIAPEGSDDRNLTHLRARLLSERPELSAGTMPMPVDDADLEAACDRYADLLAQSCGEPPVLDIVHLGLGPDGHTASLVPGDSVLEVTDRDVALTGGLYQERRRMTLTYPCINRSHRIMWQVVGHDKASALDKMLSGSEEVPGGRISTSQAIVFADSEAANG